MFFRQKKKERETDLERVVRIIDTHYAPPTYHVLTLYLTPREFWQLSRDVTVYSSEYNKFRLCSEGAMGSMWFRGAKLERVECKCVKCKEG